MESTMGTVPRNSLTLEMIGSLPRVVSKPTWSNEDPER